MRQGNSPAIAKGWKETLLKGMSMSKHTPGPWEAEFHRDGESDPGWWSIEAEIVGKSGPVADSFNRHHCIDPDEDRANATLISAAPDLLAACIAAIEATGGSQHWNGETERFLKLVEAALLKAGTNPASITAIA